MMKHKKIILSASVILVILIASGIYLGLRTKTQIKELFRMNKELQEQGYYMAEFEFKMLGIAYYLDKGHYLTSLSRINQLHNQLKTKKDLVKVPRFKNKEEEMQFYLNLQNPKTGAFMDESYPYCVYTGPTGNVLAHLDALATDLGKPIKLKYPLKYLDEINTAEKMKAYLDDVSTVGWIASKFPQTTFHNARDVLSLYFEDSVIEKHILYDISPEVKKALLEWFYENQDPETGLWGPKAKSGKLRKKDISNTRSILETFVNDGGKDIYDSFRLRYKDKLVSSMIEGFDELINNLPEDDELDEWHEWNLETSKSMSALFKYLWNEVSQENKEKTRELIERYITLKFEKFYIPQEGAFSYYPHGEHATIDGANEYRTFERIGALSGDKRKKLWGETKDNIIDLGTLKVSDLKKSDFDLISNSKSVNSLRIYKTDPDYDNLTSGVFAVAYPKKISSLDIVDLIPKLRHWYNTTDQSMGNWTSKEDVIQELESIKIEEVPAYENDIPAESIEKILKNNGKLVVVGFDVLQIPRYKVVYELGK